jgi:hypothetical protein
MEIFGTSQFFELYEDFLNTTHFLDLTNNYLNRTNIVKAYEHLFETSIFFQIVETFPESPGQFKNLANYFLNRVNIFKAHELFKTS